MEGTSGEELLRRLRAHRQLPLPEERRRIRVEAKASLRDIAQVCGVSHMAVHNWEQGATPTAAPASPIRRCSRSSNNLWAVPEWNGS